jgi:signal transduction histidine kinase
MKLCVEKKVLGGFIITISILVSLGVYAHISHRARLSASRGMSHLNQREVGMSRRVWHADVAFISLLGTTVLILAAYPVSHDLRAPLKHGALRVHVHTLPAAVADISLMRQVSTNLISNAIKYSSTKEFSQVWINAFETGTEIVYSIRDNGVGFDMQYVHKLFGVFQRLHREDEFEGTGVGLALVYRIVARHGGSGLKRYRTKGLRSFSPPRTINPND